MIKKISHALSQDNQNLAHILEQVVHLKRLDEFLKSFLEKPLGNYCRVANLRDGCLIIEVDSAAWATQLRYLTPDLLNALRSKGKMPQLRSIKTYIHPTSVKEEKKHRSPKLTMNGKTAIKEMLASLQQ